MHRYTIYCTPEQIKKALKLGAPISGSLIVNGVTYKLDKCYLANDMVYIIPTTEQMIGWLEEQGILIDINPIDGLHFYWILRTKELDDGSGKYMWESQYTTPEIDGEYDTPKEATLAAIDAALEYLESLKQ